MRYYNYDMAKRMVGTSYDSALQHYFQNNDEWGACVYFTPEKDVDFVEVCKLSNVTPNKATWTHYANIQRVDDGLWEVNTQFNGEKRTRCGYWSVTSISVWRAIASQAMGLRQGNRKKSINNKTCIIYFTRTGHISPNTNVVLLPT